MIFQPKKIAKQSLMASAILLAVSVCAAETVVYKHVDAEGRVTYSNQPIKGGVKIELEPLTIINAAPTSYAQNAAPNTPNTPNTPQIATQNAPPQSALQPSARASIPAPAPVPVYAAPISVPAAAPAVAVVTPMAAPLSASFKQPVPMEAVVQVRRGDAQRGEVQSEVARPAIQQEQIQRVEKLLADTQAALDEEQNHNDEIRALRALFASPAEAAAGSTKPVYSPQVKQRLDDHDQRIQQLEDEVAMHEDTLRRMRARAEAPRVSASN